MSTLSSAEPFNWKIVWAAFLLALFAWGLAFYGPPVFLQTLHASRGWNVSTIAGAITLHFLWSAALIIYLPEAHRRFGVRRVTQIGIVLLAAGALAWSLVAAPWQMFAAALVSGAGWAATSGAAINAIVAPWFDKGRPKALSFAFNGASCGGLLFTPLWVFLIAHFGFPTAAMAMAAALLLVMLPVSATVIGSGHPARAAPPGPAAAPARLFRDPRFLTISCAFALALFAQVGLVTHLIARLAPEFGAEGAAWTLSLITLAAVAGRSLFSAVMGDNNRRLIAAINLGMQACGTLLITFGAGMPLLLLGCVMFGLAFGNLVSLPPLIIQREFSGADVGRAVALVVAINQAVFALAPAALGILRDLSDGYTLSFALAAAIQAIAAVIVLLGRRQPPE